MASLTCWGNFEARVLGYMKGASVSTSSLDKSIIGLILNSKITRAVAIWGAGGPRRLKEGVAERDPLLYNQNS